jgi:hypothetical protein
MELALELPFQVWSRPGLARATTYIQTHPKMMVLSQDPNTLRMYGAAESEIRFGQSPSSCTEESWRCYLRSPKSIHCSSTAESRRDLARIFLQRL